MYNVVNGFCYTHRMLIKEVAFVRLDDGANTKKLIVCMRKRPICSCAQHTHGTVKTKEKKKQQLV